ncbi:MAG: hypothetical protein C4542_09015 [Dehalococcoidia bacterium]|nr:MAG: hypothetical protein C4542_09015 [Dehalococcoidia bacterium]
MMMKQTNRESPVTPVAQKAESLWRSIERIQRQVKMIEATGPQRHLVILLRREAWINLKRSWELFWAVRKLKSGPENERNAEHKP